MKKLKQSFSLLLALLLVLPSVAYGQNDVSADVVLDELVDTTQDTLDKLENGELFDKALENNSIENDSESGDEEVRVIVEVKESPAVSVGKSSEGFLSKDRVIQAGVVDKSVDVVMNQAKKAGILQNTLGTYNTLFAGFAATTKKENVALLEKLPGVKNVWISQKYIQNPMETPDMVFSHETIENRTVWEDLGYKGEKTVVAVLDSGIDHTHKDMVLTDASRAKLSEAKVNELKAEFSELKGVFRTLKVPYAYNYFDRSLENIDLGHDPSMHGQHVAGTVGANGDPNAPLGTSVQGVAPETQLLAMKVFGNEGLYSTTYTDIYMTAIEDSIKLGADVVNMSLGSPAGNVVEDDPLNDTVDNANKNGIQVVISAGNSAYASWGLSHILGLLDVPFAVDPDNGVVGTPSVSTNSLSVASYENVAMVADSIKFTVNGEEKIYPYLTSSPNSPVGVTGEVVALGTGTQADYDNYLNENGEDSLKNKVVLVKRGQDFTQTQARSEKYGAALHIVYNDEARGDALVRMATNNGQVIPSLFTTNKAGVDLLTSDQGSLQVTNEKSKTPNPNAGLLSDFSSRGPSPILEMKPEISAPGGQIYSTLNGDEYGVMSGTSMAAPHASGGLALIRQYIENDAKFKNITDLETKSRLSKALMMNSADILLNPDSDDAPYAVRAQGAGGMNIRKAVNIPMTATKPGTLDAKLELKVLSSKTFSVDVEFTNYTDRELSYNVDLVLVKDSLMDLTSYGSSVVNTLATELVDGSVDVDKLVIAPNEKVVKTFNITVNDDELENQFIDGWLKFESEAETEVVLPFFGFLGDYDNVRTLDAIRFGEGVGQDGPSYNYLGSGLPLTGLFTESATNPGQVSFYSEEMAAISPGTMEGMTFNTDHMFPVLTYTRNIKQLKTTIVDENGKFVTLIDSEENLRKNYFNSGQGSPYTFKSNDAWYGVAKGKTVQDGKYFMKFESLPYLAKQAQEVKIPMYVDTSRPEIESVKFTSEDYELKVTATDETTGVQYFFVSVQPFNGAEAGEEKTAAFYVDELMSPVDNTYTMDISELVDGIASENLGNTVIEVIAFDHAMNLASAAVKANNQASQDIPYVYVIKPDIYDMGNSPEVELDGYVIDTNPVTLTYSVNGRDEVELNTEFAPSLKVDYFDSNSAYQAGWTFNSTITLDEGYNEILVFAKSQENPDKQQTVRREVWLDTKAPVVELVDYDKTVEVDQSANVSLRVTEQLKAFSIHYVEGNDLVSSYDKAFNINQSGDVVIDHSFELPVTEEGPYLVELKVVDAVGNETLVEPFVINADEVDKAQLQELVDSVNALDKSPYTDESIEQLNEALANAQAVLDDLLATQEEVDSALEALNNALENLVEKEVVNKEALQAKVDELEALDRSQYTNDSLAKLDEALEKAKEVLSNPEATQVEVDLALQELEQAQEALKELADKSELQAVVDKAEALDKSKYTEESLVALNSALAKAKAVLEQENPSQEQVDIAKLALELAISNLKVKPVEKIEGYVLTGSNLRRSPNGEIVKTTTSSIKISGVVEGNWVKFNLDGQELYVWKPLIKSELPIVEGYINYATNLRQTPNGKILTTIKPVVKVKGELQGNWVKVTVNGIVGYVYRPLIDSKSIMVKGYVSGDLNVRQSPNGKIVGLLKKGTYVQGLPSGNWLKIKFQGKDAYIYAPLVNKQ